MKLKMKIFLLFLLISTFIYCKKEAKHEIKLITKNGGKFKILHIMSYHSPWEWTDNQLKGFQEALKDVDIEYKIFQMDTVRKSDEKWKEEIGKKARELIDEWKPDLVYTTDDNAQKYVVKYYINKELPFVFSGVNADPKDYGFENSTNIAGVLEQEHILPTINLLKKIKPSIKKIYVLTDSDATWPRVIDRIKSIEKELEDIKISSYEIFTTFSDFKNRVLSLQKENDAAICFLGVFRYKNETGNNVPLIDVQKWVVENSKLPDFSFWIDRIPKGTLCSVTVSAYEQGFAAGKIARAILVEGKKATDFPFKPTIKGNPTINIARAKKIGLNIDAEILLNSIVFENFEWEENRN